jgi:NDP-sugar pyrophosphorylase family protein
LLAVGYQSDAIEQELASFPVPIVYVHEKTPLGTGGAIAQAMRQVESQTALILNGDVYVEFDLATFYAAHQAKRAQVSLVCCPVDDAERYGTVVLGAEGEVVAFREKVPGKGYVNGGVYLFEQTIAMPEQTTFSIERDFFPRLIGHRFFGHISEGIFIDIGTPPSYRLAQELLRNKVCLYRTY